MNTIGLIYVGSLPRSARSSVSHQSVRARTADHNQRDSRKHSRRTCVPPAGFFRYTLPMKKEARHATLYRAYRPATLAEVRGQGHVVDVLEKAIKNNKPAHAYLFSGGRGTGKTSVARILARSLSVTDKDLYEIDAASNRGIDDIRSLREGVYVMPFESPYRFYIIDEAHMLTKEAWNALLKTIEEPPAHVVFVFA